MGSFKNPADLFIDEISGTVVIADTGNDRIVICDTALKNAKSVSGFGDENKDALKTPTGVFLAYDKKIYVADSGNERVVRFNTDGTLDKIIPKPQSALLGEKFVYKPLKVAVNSMGSIFIVADGVFEGILEINQNGEFLGYAGMNKVVPNIWDLLWRAISTQKQRESMIAFLPVNFNNIDVDGGDFLLATAQMENNLASNAVKRLNPGGDDVLRNGTGTPIIGDLGNINTGRVTGNSLLFDVCSLPGNAYACIDQKRGKVFVYDADGDMLMVFGGMGSQTGLVSSVTAIDSLGKDLYVLDAGMNRFTIFTPTQYGATLLDAVRHYSEGDYDLSTKEFMEVYRLNSNNELAYTGIGKTHLRSGNYKDALASFRLANNRPYYSKALKQYRRQLLSGGFTYIFALIILIIALIILRIVLKKFFPKKKKAETDEADSRLDKYLHGLDYAFRILTHPFKGPWELKHEKRGNLLCAFTLVTLFVITMVCRTLYTGFLFNTTDVRTVNPLLEAVKLLMPLVLWCVANWCLTTLMDGEGSMSDIIISASYALAPVILIQIPLILLSNLIITEEFVFYIFFDVLAFAWLGMLLLCGNMVIHNFTAKRTIVTALLTVFAMAVIVFLVFLFVNLGFEVYSFIRSIYREITFR